VQGLLSSAGCATRRGTWDVETRPTINRNDRAPPGDDR
jgi:hypothetical protein